MCMDIKRPTTYSVTFNRTLFGLKVNWDKPIFEQEDPPKGLWSAYSSPCSGDSGSPQMLYVVTPDEPKFVVAAILSGGVGQFYNKTSKTIYRAPCGTHTKNTEKRSKKHSQNILRDIGISDKITYGPILQWIKSKLRL